MKGSKSRGAHLLMPLAMAGIANQLDTLLLSLDMAYFSIPSFRQLQALAQRLKPTYHPTYQFKRSSSLFQKDQSGMHVRATAKSGCYVLL